MSGQALVTPESAMFMTNLILALAVAIMIGLAIWLFASTEGGASRKTRQQQVRIVERDRHQD
jgi:hypothetical protein